MSVSFVRLSSARNSAISAFSIWPRPLLGKISVAWIYDPALVKISPNILLPASQYLAAGAFRYPTRTPPEAVEFALAASRTRRQLHDEGKYTPRNYGIYLPRRELLRWARVEWARRAGGGPVATPE